MLQKMKRRNKWLIGTVAAVALGIAFWPNNNETLETKVEEPVKERRFDRAKMRKRLLEMNKRIELPKEIEEEKENSDLPSCLRCENPRRIIKREWYIKERTIKSETPYVCGEKHGREKEWWPNGQLKFTQEYVCGVCDGERVEWYPNGQLKTRYMMTKNHPADNNAFFWHENGKVAYIKEDLENGCQRLRHWYANGHMERLANRCNDQHHGEWGWWYRNGQKQEELNYADGFLDGKQTTWHENGQKKSEINYDKGIKHGDFKKFNEKGDLVFEEHYVDGKLEEATEFDENGSYPYSIND